MGWKIQDQTNNGKGYIRILDAEGKTVCDIFPFGARGGCGIEVARQNAKTIIAADRMFDALKGLLDWVEEGCPEGGHYVLTEAKQAIEAGK